MPATSSLKRLAVGDQSVSVIAGVLARGGVAVMPTDTVYGIAQSVLANPQGPLALFSIKRRPLGKVVPWLVEDADALLRFGVEVPPYARALAERFWPGGLTLVVRASSEVPLPYRAADGTVALRCPGSAFVRSIIRASGSPLATTSANTSGCPAPTSYGDVEQRILDECDVAVDGGTTPDGVSSTVVVCVGEGPHVVREGAVPSSEIFRVVDEFK